MGPGAPNFAQDTDVSPDGRTLYVSRGYLGDVAAFDLASGRLQWQRPLNTMRADHMTVTPDGRSLFVSAMVDDRVYRIATANGEITGEVLTGVYPHDNKLSKDGTLVYNSSLGLLKAMPRPPGAKVSAERRPVPADHRRCENAAGARSHSGSTRRSGRGSSRRTARASMPSSRINTWSSPTTSRTKKVVRRLELPMKPGITAADWDFEAPHHGLALTDDGKTLCLAGRASDYAALVSAPDLTLLATIPVGDGPGWAEVDEGGRACFVANARSDELSIISIAERREIARLPDPQWPQAHHCRAHASVGDLSAQDSTIVAMTRAESCKRSARRPYRRPPGHCR